MKYTCTLSALSLIDGLEVEMLHLYREGLSELRYQGFVIDMYNLKNAIRREYARLHPNETMPGTAVIPEPKNHT